MIREAISAVARNESLGGLISRTPVARDVVRRLVAGETVESALAVALDLADRGFWVSLERAAPTVRDEAEADGVLTEYVDLVDRIVAAGLADACEVSVFVEAMGTDARPDDARRRLAALCGHATSRGVAVMVGMGPAPDVDRTIAWVGELTDEGLRVGMTLQACLKRSERDCETYGGGRVRLVKGSHHGEPGLAHDQPIEIDKAFVRCAKKLLAGTGEPSFATHDPRLLEVLESLVQRYGRSKHSYEFAMYMGRLEAAQERLADHGERVRVYVPYGPDWFQRLMGGLAEQPSSIAAAVRSLLP